MSSAEKRWASALDAAILLAVAALWGSSFLFIRVTVPDLEPMAFIEARVLLAGLALLAVVALLGIGQPVRRGRGCFSGRPPVLTGRSSGSISSHCSSLVSEGYRAC